MKRPRNARLRRREYECTADEKAEPKFCVMLGRRASEAEQELTSTRGGYKTGAAKGQRFVDDSLQLSIYALACRDALGLGTPERVTMYFTESALRLSTTRSDEQLDQARADVLARVLQMRAGEFGAMPGKPCEWCDYARMCPERA